MKADDLLTREEFKKAFCMKERDVESALADGMPFEVCDGVMMFSRRCCHAWFAGGWIKTVPNGEEAFKHKQYNTGEAKAKAKIKEAISDYARRRS